MRKWTLRLGTTLLASLLLTIGSVSFLLGTQSGTNFLVSQAEKQMAGQLHIGSATGTVLDRLELTDILFESQAAGKIAFETLFVNWKSSDLLTLHLHIIELRTTDIHYTLSQLEKPPSTTPTVLTDLAVPFAITIDKLLIDSISLRTTQDAEPFVITQAELTALWNTSGILVQELFVSIPEVAVKAKGKIQPSGNYPLTATTEIHTLSTDYPSVTLHGKYEGDLQKLTVKETLQGDVEATIQGTLENIVNALAWNLDFTLHHFAPQLLIPDLPGSITGKIQSTGTLQGLNAKAQLSMRDKEESIVNWDAVLDADLSFDALLLTVKQCNLTHLNSPAAIDLTGTVDTNQQLALKLNWQELQWPLTGKSEYTSTAGELSLTGSIDDYLVNLQSSISGSLLPESTLQLSSKGNTESVHDINLTLNTFQGNVVITGAAAWAPSVQWKLTTTAAKINPGEHYPQWPGSLNWLIQSEGHMAESGLFTTFAIENLQGTLRERPLAVSGNITVNAEDIRLENMILSSGNTELTAHGLLGEDSDLQWNIHVADFSDLFPEAKGQLSAHGAITGKRTEPKITANAKGSAMAISQMKLQALQLKANLDLSGINPFSIDLVVQDLQSGENLLPEFTLKSDGQLTNHTLDIFASHKLADLSLATRGSYDKEQWQGTLDSLVLDSKGVGKWQNSAPAKLTATAETANLAPLCLTQKQSELCISAAWDDKSLKTGAKATLTGLPLNAFATWFPETLVDLGGSVSFEAKATMQKKLQATLHAAITPGAIEYQTVKDTGTIPHEGLQLDLQVADDGLNADFWLNVNSNVLSGKLKSPNLLLSDIEQSPTLDGEIKIDAKNFTFIEALVEDVENLSAQIDSNFTIAGTLADPEVSGKGKLHIKNILIPVAGLEFHDTSLNILANTSTIQFDGILHSGKGSMAVAGTTSLKGADNYPALITLKGDNFRLVNLPNIQVFLSSNLRIERTKELTRLSGTVAIPKADILLRELPKGTETASPDIVIIQEQQKEKKSNSPMQMDIKVSLGKKVHFAGLGVNGFMDGQLNITAEPTKQMLGSGEFHIRQGSYRAYGQDLQVENGVISFPGGPLTQPGINLRATRSVGEVVAGISAIGPAAKPRITTFSKPPMSESQVLSYIITGTSPDTGGAKLSVGRQINNKLSIAVGTDTKTGESEFVARYRLNRNIHVETTTGTDSNAADIYYTTELGGEDKTDKNGKKL